MMLMSSLDRGDYQNDHWVDDDTENDNNDHDNGIRRKM